MSVDLLTKEGRQKCWDAKDIYWKCLDENKGDIEKCKQSRDNYESNCSKSWVKYFDRRKDYLKFKKSLETGEFDKVKSV